MKNKILNIIFILLSLLMFVAIIILTNDNVKQRISTDKIVPFCVIAEMVIIAIAIVLARKK